jgi:hypothetical protein
MADRGHPLQRAKLCQVRRGTGPVGLPLPESHTQTICLCSDGASPNSNSLVVNRASPSLQRRPSRHDHPNAHERRSGIWN